MKTSILTSTKKLLGLADEYTAFDLDIVSYINSAFTSLSQLGVTNADGFVIEDATQKWEELGLSKNELSMVKTYVYLKTRLLFDPPSTSFAIEAINKQILEHEWRLTTFRETNKDTSYAATIVEEIEVT